MSHSRLPFRANDAIGHGTIRIIDASGMDIGYATTLSTSQQTAEANARLFVDGANNFYAIDLMRRALEEISADAPSTEPIHPGADAEPHLIESWGLEMGAFQAASRARTTLDTIKDGAHNPKPKIRLGIIDRLWSLDR